jgi:hypothetical protein
VLPSATVKLPRVAAVVATEVRMRRVTTTLALALCLLGCGLAGQAGEPFALVTSWEPGSAESPACRATWWAAGELVLDPKHGTALKVESGDYLATKGATMPVLWWPSFTGRRLGNEVTVLDPDGNVVATTGRTYRINGSFEQVGFIACGDEVFPEGSPCFVPPTLGPEGVAPPCRATDDWP